MPKTRIDSAISRGLGVSTSGAPLEPLTLEAIFHSAALVVDVMTENRLRALQDLKFILTKAGAQVTPSSYLFTRNGVILVKGDKDKVDADKVLEMALEIEGEGVREVEEEEGEEGEVLVLTDPAEITRVAGELRERVPEGVEVMSKGMEWVPNEDTMVGGLGERGEELERVVGALEEYQDVVGVYTNVREEE
ncbi:YebC-like protein [Ascodesmis nigricans]|uniref:YebC-like protein n=1 Tax=Ascodesmis nigricans TaxID=341454 RepID=A0A4S2MMT1_9PEZI|nr:YebC-like protein [Ascodesmis nigricans]